MKYKLEKINNLSGEGASIYSIQIEGEKDTLLENFLEEYSVKFEDEIGDIVDKIIKIGHEYGARSNLINEGKGGLFDGVFDIRDNPDIQLRLYGLKLRHTLIILGGGGQKTTQKIQEDPNLTYYQEIMKDLSKQIDERLANEDFSISEDNYDLEGNLEFEKK